MTKPICKNCGSDDIHMNLLASYDAELGAWLIDHSATEVVCNVCCVEQDKQKPRFIYVREELVNKGMINEIQT